MRRVNVVTGLKQRMYDILGEQVSGGADGEITAWSIQSAMLSNFRRICKCLVGNNVSGKILSGLDVFGVGGPILTVSVGYGVTANGDIISVQKPINMVLSGTKTVYIYLRYRLSALHSATDGYKQTSIVNESAQEIVYDEYGAAFDQNISGVDFLFQTENISDIGGDDIHIATVSVSSGSITSITAINQVDYYSEGTFVGVIFNSSTNQEILFTYTRMGKIVVLSWPEIINLAGDRGSGNLLTRDRAAGTQRMPDEIRPLTSQFAGCYNAHDVSVGYANGIVEIQPSGVGSPAQQMEFYFGSDNSFFNPAVNNTLFHSSITYQIH